MPNLTPDVLDEIERRPEVGLDGGLVRVTIPERDELCRLTRCCATCSTLTSQPEPSHAMTVALLVLLMSLQRPEFCRPTRLVPAAIAHRQHRRSGVVNEVIHPMTTPQPKKDKP